MITATYTGLRIREEAIRIFIVGGEPTVRVSGAIGEGLATELSDSIAAAVGCAGSGVVVDLTRCTAFHPSAVAALATGLRRARSRAVDLVVACPPDAAAVPVLRAEVPGLVRIFDDRDAAMEALRGA